MHRVTSTATYVAALDPWLLVNTSLRQSFLEFTGGGKHLVNTAVRSSS